MTPEQFVYWFSGYVTATNERKHWGIELLPIT